MKLDQALVKIGVEVVRAEKNGEDLVLLLRVHTDDPRNQPRWISAATGFTRKVWECRKGNTWSGEVSKLLVTPDGEHVLFYWRVTFTGHVQTAQRVLGEAIIEALREGVEITSMPLIGQKTYEHNPAAGKFKGGYALSGAGASAGPGLVSREFQK